MLRNEYLKRVRLLGHRADKLFKSGREDEAEALYFQMQDLDFAADPELSGPEPWEQEARL